MCKAMEDMRKEAAREAALETTLEMAEKLIKRGKDTIEEISDLTGLTMAQVQELAQAATA